MQQFRVPEWIWMVGLLEVVDGIRWEILEASRSGEHLLERLSHLGEALDLVAVLEEAVEEAMRNTAQELRTRDGDSEEPSLEVV